MTDPFGIVAGSIGIAAAFDACLDVLSKVQIARRSGSDLRTYQLQLAWLRLRLSRWGEAIRVHEDPQFSNPNPTTEEVRIAKRTIFQILTLLENSDRVAKKSSGERVQTDDAERVDNAFMPADLLTLYGNIQKVIARRQRTSSNLIKLTHWVVHRREHLLQLIEDISSLMDSLEQVFSAPQRREILASEELQQFSSTMADQQSSIRYLEMLAKDIDKTFNNVAAYNNKSGHQIGDQSTFDNARVQNGHTFTQVWATAAGTLPVGQGMTISIQKTGGHSRVRNGDVYIEKDDFWA
ncbi:hypothetical protein HD806DRAFT_492654 [Xylariaceae sp. AK1471]|nr:hypothetical protein HD806DRAFT_492654 [Xylariaceae sp. AK1471]